MAPRGIAPRRLRKWRLAASLRVGCVNGASRHRSASARTLLIHRLRLVTGNQWQTKAMAARFLQLADVAEELSVTVSQVYHMVRSGELPAIKVGGRGQWRVERERLEAYIQQKYSETAEWVSQNP